MSYAAYPEYKDSGVEWLGEVPAHWRLGSFRHLIKSLSNGTTANQVDQEDGSVAVSRIETISKGEVNFSKVGYVRLSEVDNRFLLTVGDILFSHINSLPMIGNAAVYEGEKPLLHGMNLLRIQPEESVASSWVAYWLKSKNIRQEVESKAKPAINQASISTVSVKSLPALIPPESEQRKITAFLDHETARIDALVEEQQRLIALLKEKRQAVISHAVTKGLNPNVPMKDSGVEWLGEVPEHWEVVALRRVLKRVEQGWSPNASNVPAAPSEWGVVKLSAIKKGCFIEKENKALLSDTNPDIELEIKAGDLLVTRANTPELVGDACIVKSLSESRLMLSDLVYRLKVTKRANAQFICWFLISDSGRSQITSDARGSSMTMAKISQSHIKSWLLAVPPIDEQYAIASYVESEFCRIDQLTRECVDTLQLLGERRSALISAAVTGKIDVRGWQPPLELSERRETADEV